MSLRLQLHGDTLDICVFAAMILQKEREMNDSNDLAGLKAVQAQIAEALQFMPAFAGELDELLDQEVSVRQNRY